MIKVLWLSNVDLSLLSSSQSGTWIHSMYKGLESCDTINICANITFTSKDAPYNSASNGLKNYYLPLSFVPNGMPSKKAIEYVVSVILSEKPDILHIWGIETCWGLITGDERLSEFIKLVDIQGIKSVCAREMYFYGGLSHSVINRMNGPLSLFFKNFTINKSRDHFKKWGSLEKTILSGVKNVSVQSSWVNDVISSLGVRCNVLRTGIMLRSSFSDSTPWNQIHKKSSSPVLFTTTSNVLHKGFHVTLRAFAIVKNRFPNATLIVAGMKAWSPSLKTRLIGGYQKYIYELSHNLHVEDSVVYLGNLDEHELLENMYNADVFVCSSFIETYCLALAEAVSLGVPSVASYSSALPELLNNGKNGLLFPIGDEFVCASQINRLLSDEELSMAISKQESEWYRNNLNNESALKKQIEIYQNLIS